MTPASLLQRELQRDSARPLVTWYDDSTGERIEVSVATVANWAVKTANLLVDEHGLEPGDSVALRPATHWLATVVALGAWTAGIALDVRPDSNAPVLPDDPREFTRVVLAQPDGLLVSPPADGETALHTGARSLSLTELVRAAGAPPESMRLMTVLPLDTVEGLLAAVVAPLLAGGSAVMVTAADSGRLADRAATERVTHTFGVELPDLPAVSF